jgi:phenylacetate-CoA ligase
VIYNEQYETMPQEILEAIQLRRLQNTVERVYATVAFYKHKFDEAGIKPGDIASLKDLKKLPFTTKAELRDSYPFGLFSVPMGQIVRIHASSGMTGKPTVVGYTRRDIEIWSELISRVLAAAGVSKDDILHNAFGYGLFTGGLGFHYGAEKLGVSVIPVSTGNTKRQIMIMKDFRPSVLTGTPSYALHLWEVAKEIGIDFKKDLAIRTAILGAEPWSERMRGEIEEKLGINALDVYGLSEVMGPGVAIECIEGKNGLHIFEDHFIPEVIDPDTGESLPYGKTGELVFTTITKEGIPLIRYRTQDISALYKEPCRCGRTIMRMARITGRTDDMLIIRGINVFPSQIENVLLQHKGVEPHYLIVLGRERFLDTLEVQVEVNEYVFSDEVRKLEILKKEIEADLKETLGVFCNVKLVEPKSIERSVGKAKRIIDKRRF